MIIIKGSEKHMEGIMILCKDCSQNMTNKSIDQWDEVYPNREIFLNDIRNDSLYLAVADDQEQIMACIVLNDYQEPEYGEVNWKYDGVKTAVIHRLMVHPRHEGKGIARHLVKHIEKIAGENQYSAIRLDVFEKNARAVSFYEKLGYEVAGEVLFRKGRFHCCEKLL